MLSDLVTQRWGVASTRLHLDMEALARGVLLFDRIVLPTPSDVAEADRWDQLGWDTQAQALRMVQLGELVHFAPWDEQLRADWRARWEHVKEIGVATRELAYAVTPEVIATTAWGDVMASAGEDFLPTVRPVPVVWTSAVSSIVRRVTGNEPDEQSPGKPTAAAPYEQLTALRFRRVLQQDRKSVV